MAIINLPREISNNSFIQTKYKDTLSRMITLNIPYLSKEELNRAIDYSISKRSVERVNKILKLI